MKRHLFVIPLMAISMAPLPSLANLALAQKHSCTACHAVDSKLVGPAYADVARKHRGQKNAETTLIANIKKGGSGKWGAIPMPAQTNLSDADAKTLARWILSIAK